MENWDEKRSIQSWQDVVNEVSVLREEHVKKRYRTLARQAPAMILKSGLGQLLAFLYAKRSDERDRNTNEYKDSYGDFLMYRHLSHWLVEKIEIHCPREVKDNKKQDILARCINAEDGWKSDKIRFATRESLAYLQWNRRYSDGILPKPEGD